MCVEEILYYAQYQHFILGQQAEFMSSPLRRRDAFLRCRPVLESE